VTGPRRRPGGSGRAGSDLPAPAEVDVADLASILRAPCVALLVPVAAGPGGAARPRAGSAPVEVLEAWGWPAGATARLDGPDRVEVALPDGTTMSGPVAPVASTGRTGAVLAAVDGPDRVWDAGDGRHLRVLADLVSSAWAHREADAALRRLRDDDGLTGLASRERAERHLAEVLGRQPHGEGRVAVVSIDVDHFKVINDSLGSRAGDEVLRRLARRLRAELRSSDLAARSGGDGFVVVCLGVGDEAEAGRLADRLRRALSSVLVVDDRELPIAVTAGVVLAPPPPGPSDAGRLRPVALELLGQAETALHQAKALGRGRTAVFEAPQRERAVRRLNDELALRRAIDRRELVLHYQPVVDLRTGEIRQVEALVRWQDPGRGLVAPAEFIALAEETGLIAPLGAWVLEEACAQTHDWTLEGASTVDGPLPVAVNLSARQTVDDDLVTLVDRILRSSGLPPGQLILEITESAIMGEAERAITMLAELRDLGVHLSIDDFGTGYSSLAYLKRLPVDTLKIDRSFVAGLGVDRDDSAIVGATIRLAEALGLETVAEGVENAGQVAELLALGATTAQGFYFARPEPAAELRRRLGLWRPRPVAPLPVREAGAPLLVGGGSAEVPADAALGPS
jgi:diguanylate cyclase (GGDEF)-like protein